MDQHNNINGVTEQVPEVSILDRKPLVTYAGDKELFQSLEATLSASLPQEATEWRRSYGRAIKSIHVSATFVPFTKEVLPKEGDFRLIEQPMLHTYWTQCSDVETYKNVVRDDIELWMRVLIQYNLTDWMIVLVETYDFRKTNKLIPRTTVLDKIRGDFGAKHADRCLSVINPLRSESRSAGSWRGLIVNFRLLLLTAYDRTLLKFEEIIRDQRERRNQTGWSFTKYFLLQEELAFVLEMLGVYEEALVQYDELDALFTQFILNSHLGESPSWLSQFCVPLDSWAGLTLTPKVNVRERSRIQNNTMTLLQFRNYLFSRQCAMLLYSKKPWEVAERTLPFLHNCLSELSLLEVSNSPGAVSCWVFLSCLEVLDTCETYTESSQIEQYSVYTAGLWAYARQKLAELGELCGLMPGKEQTSEQIHRVVEISSGLDESSAGPVERLKQALSSQQAFCKEYLELSELAMGTYKHIGRVRCARSIGHDLAKFYRTIGDYSTATSFLQNALHCFEQDGWKQLAARTRLQLAQCYLQLGDLHRYVKTCASIASSPELDMEKRMEHYNEMCKVLQSSTAEPPWTGLLSDCMTLTDIDIQVDKGTTTITAVLGINSGLPVSTPCSNIAVSIVPVKQHDKQSQKHKDSQTNCRRRSKEDLVPMNPILQRLPVVSRLDYQQDKSLAGASIDIKNQKSLLRRQDSHGKYRKVSTITKNDFTKCLSTTDIVLEPGHNVISLTLKDNEPGSYRLGQFSLLVLGKLDLLSSSVTHKLYFEITQNPPSVIIVPKQETLLAGIKQNLSVDINTGGHHITAGSVLRLDTSKGLSIQHEQSEDPFVRTLEILLPETKPNKTLQIPIFLLAQLPSQNDPTTIEHTVTIKAPWTEDVKEVTLVMQPALMSSLKLHTARLKKFLHVTVSGLSHQKLSVKMAHMAIISPVGANLLPANPPDMGVEISMDRKVGYMWLLELEPNTETIPVKTEFTLQYEPLNDSKDSSPLFYKCTFDITNHKTLYLIESRVEPVRGSEFCRVSTVCQLIIKVRRVNNTPDTSLMYEVLGEHNMWAICGRTTGVLSLDADDVHTVTMDVMPLINGYLPLPIIRLSKYIPANTKSNSRSDCHPRLEPFCAGEVYNISKGTQVHVIAAVSPQDT